MLWVRLKELMMRSCKVERVDSDTAVLVGWKGEPKMVVRRRGAVLLVTVPQTDLFAAVFAPAFTAISLLWGTLQAAHNTLKATRKKLKDERFDPNNFKIEFVTHCCGRRHRISVVRRNGKLSFGGLCDDAAAAVAKLAGYDDTRCRHIAQSIVKWIKESPSRYGNFGWRFNAILDALFYDVLLKREFRATNDETSHYLDMLFSRECSLSRRWTDIMLKRHAEFAMPDEGLFPLICFAPPHDAPKGEKAPTLLLAPLHEIEPPIDTIERFLSLVAAKCRCSTFSDGLPLFRVNLWDIDGMDEYDALAIGVATYRNGKWHALNPSLVDGAIERLAPTMRRRVGAMRYLCHKMLTAVEKDFHVIGGDGR